MMDVTPPRGSSSAARRDFDCEIIDSPEKDKRPALLRRHLSLGAEWEWPTNVPASVAAELLQTEFPGFMASCSGNQDVLYRWRCLGEQLTCSICRFTLHRPVDVAGCGHFVCRSHVLDIYQNLYALRCPLCRAERPPFHGVSIDDTIRCNELLYDKIQNLKRRVDHEAALADKLDDSPLVDSPLQDRFNRLFFASADF